MMEQTYPMEIDRCLICPIRTYTDSKSSNEIRGYKLGKQKFSYNGISFLLEDSQGPQKILSAVEAPIGKEIDAALKQSCLKYLLHLENGNELCAYIFLVFATNICSEQAQMSNSRDDVQKEQVEWQVVTRRDCLRGCEGPLLQGIRRFGKTANGSNEEKMDKARDPSKVYIAIDEACAHMNPKTERFRLVLGLYSGKKEVATSVSSSIRILANNDAPRGAASFNITCRMHGSQASAVAEPAEARPALQDVKVNIERTRPAPKPEQSKPVGQGKGTGGNRPSIKDLPPKKRILEPTRKLSYASESWSLTSVVERLLKRFGNRVGSLLYLASLAEELDVKKRRLYDVMNVLESIQIVERKAQDMYVWKAATSVQEALDALALEAEMKKSMAESDGVMSGSEAGQAGTQAREDVPFCASLKMLSEEFVQLFLTEQGQVLLLDKAVSAILGDQSEHAQTVRRRLYDAANVLSCLHLVVKFQTLQGPGYLWLGCGGFQERLREISGVPATAAARSRKRKSTDSLSTPGPALQPLSLSETRAPKRRAIEPPRGSSPAARHARLPSDEFADGFLARTGFRIPNESPPESPRPTNRQPLSPISLPARYRASETTSASKKPPLPPHISPSQKPTYAARKPPRLSMPPGASHQQGQPVTSPTLTYNPFETFQPGCFPTPFTLPFRKVPSQLSSVLRPTPRRLSDIPSVPPSLSSPLKAGLCSAEGEPCCIKHTGLGHVPSQPGGQAPSDFTPYKQPNPSGPCSAAAPSAVKSSQPKEKAPSDLIPYKQRVSSGICSDAPSIVESTSGMANCGDVQAPSPERSPNGLAAPLARYPAHGNPPLQEQKRNEGRVELSPPGRPAATWTAQARPGPSAEGTRLHLATSALRRPRSYPLPNSAGMVGWATPYSDSQSDRPLELLNNVTQALLLLRNSAVTSNGGDYMRAISEARTRILPHVHALGLGRQTESQSRTTTQSAHDNVAGSQTQR